MDNEEFIIFADDRRPMAKSQVLTEEEERKERAAIERLFEKYFGAKNNEPAVD